jgi:E1 N-terminal domain/ThiF family
VASDYLTPEARRENALTLAALLGLDVDSAALTLEVSVAVSTGSDDPTADAIAKECQELLERTVKEVSRRVPTTCAAELVIGAAAERSSVRRVYLQVTDSKLHIGTQRQSTRPCEPLAPVLALLAACYASAATLYHALGDTLPVGLPDPLIVDFNELGLDLNQLGEPIVLHETFLAGAGAIGNGLLWAARHLNFQGRLVLVDDDTVSSGNLNRQIWFDQQDIGLSKADRLASKAQSAMPQLELVPQRVRLQDLPDKRDGPWLRRLIVAVDSRRARRQLQNEFPGEVFDASTTDIREVVLHHHRQPTTAACLSCIYEPDTEEFARERHIAEHLGVSLEEVRTERISMPAALVIAARYTGITAKDIEGTAYDSFFKRMCSEGQLRWTADKRVVAPFAFVSVLAGTLLALEIVRRLGPAAHDRNFNYWRVSPWHPPMRRRRIQRPRQPGCSFCSDRILAKVNGSMW